jgi:ribosome-associated protein
VGDTDSGRQRLRINGQLEIPLAEVTLRTSRSSGPGGQHANVTASRVEAIFDAASSPSLNEAQRERVMTRAGPRVVAVAQDQRSQARNRQLALERLARRLRDALDVPRARRATRPSAASRTSRLEQKRRAGRRKVERRRPVEDD